MKLFVGYNLSSNIIKVIEGAIVPLKRKFGDVNWIKDENIHLTLKFLGETDKDLKVLIGAMEKVKLREFSFKIGVSSLGYFDRGDMIVWLGLEFTSRLIRLFNTIESEFKRVGFAKDKRNYSPHITLGRAKKLNVERVKDLKCDIDHFRFNPQPIIILNSVSLIQSTLTASGPIYNELYKIHLREGL